MTQSSQNVSSRFFQPALSALPLCQSTRLCPSLSDSQWIQLGVNRVIDAPASGRGFLQSLVSQGSDAPSHTHFFETLKSQRRLNLCKELNEQVANGGPQHLDDALGEFDELKKFEVRAGDGHWHSHASHDAAQLSSVKKDGTEVTKKYPVGHLYSLDLRTHLTTSDQVNRRKEHDMRGLKRVGAEGLREGVKKGRKLLMVWDSAAIDFKYWYKLKQGHGVYFLCRDKEIEKTRCGDRIWDRELPINEGVVADRQVGSSASGYLVRIVEFQDPASGKNHRFITNEMTLSPGLLAHLYRMRWDIEWERSDIDRSERDVPRSGATSREHQKVFDEVKNRLNEKKAWASSATAKSMQGHFIALAHNLMLLLSDRLKKEEGIEDIAEQERRIKRRYKESSQRESRGFAKELSTWLMRATQRGVKFIHWLRVQLHHPNSWEQACASLTKLSTPVYKAVLWTPIKNKLYARHTIILPGSFFCLGWGYEEC